MITVVGSINLDLVASVARLPRPGETVTGGTLARHPGGKGANQALAARRLGASVRLIGAVGRDAMADGALALLREDAVDLSDLAVLDGQPTGVALIGVESSGENLIMVAAGANGALTPDHLPARIEGDLLLQLEIPPQTALAAAGRSKGRVIVNLAPAMDVPPDLIARADVLIVNEAEARFYGSGLDDSPALIARTLGAAGAELWQGGQCLARAVPPEVAVVDAVGAGDAFVGALAVALFEGMAHERALRFACTAGALATTRPGAQPSLPRRDDLASFL